MTRVNTRRSASVPDAYRGLSLQATRFLYYLLKVEPGATVSLEYFEDVGVEHADGRRTAEQDKSYVAGNPLTDRSVAFWKALRNWVDSVNAGQLSSETTHFIIYAPGATMGAIAEAFNSSTSLEASVAALSDARRALWKDDRWDIAKEGIDHLNVVLNDKTGIVSNMLVRLSIDDEAVNPEQEIRQLLSLKLVGDDSMDDVIQWGHGWVKREIDKAVQDRKPPRIPQTVFHNALRAYVRTHDRVNILRSVAGEPAEGDVKNELAVRRYVKQMRIIDMDEIDILAAVNDFLSASIDRTTWADEGLVSEHSLASLAKELTTAWRNIKRRTLITVGHKCAKDQGQVTFSECMTHHARVDQLETPLQFIRGSWHTLAEDLSIGWHPDYKSALSTSDASTTTTGGSEP